MMSNKKEKNSTVFYVGWIFCVVVLVGFGIWGTRTFYSNTVKDYTIQYERQIERLFLELKKSYEISIVSDSLNSSNLDSLNAEKIEHAKVVEEAITSQILDQVNNSINLYQSKAESNSRVLFIWGTILALVILISILFAYIGLKKHLTLLSLNSGQDSYNDVDHRGYMPSGYSSENYSIKREDKSENSSDYKKEEYMPKNVINKEVEEVIKEYKPPVFVTKDTAKKENTPNDELLQPKVEAVPPRDYDNEISSITKEVSDENEKISSLKILISEIKGDNSLDTEQKNLYLYKAFFYLAQSFKNAGETDKALAVYEKLIQTNSSQPAVFFERGNLYRDMGKYTEAINDYNQVLNLFPDSDEGYLHRAYVYSEIGDYGKAIEDYNKVISLGRANANIISKRGEAYYYNQNYEAALADFDKVIEAAPSSMEAYRKRGMTNYRLEKFEAALSDFDKTLSLASDADNLIDIKELRQEAILKIKQLKEVVFVEKAEKEKPVTENNELVYFNQATEAFNKSDFNTAIDYFKKVLAINPENTEVLFMKGMAHNYLKEYDLAIIDFNKSLALSSAQPEIYYNRANVYVNLQKIDDALADYTSAINLNPTIPEVYFNRANIYYSRGRFGEALQDYTKAIEINPEYAKAYFNRGLAYKAAEQNLKAIADFKKVMVLDADNIRIVEKAKKQIETLSSMLGAKENLEE